MSKKLIFFSAFFVVLFLGFYFVMKAVVPGYSQSELKPISAVHPFSFTDQEGKRVTERTMEGKVYVVEYFYTTCKGLCPIMNNSIKKVYTDLADEPDFRILSHTSDPAIDTVARMKKYADSLGADPSRWLFLTGRKDSLYRMARISYLLDDPKNNAEDPNEQFIHTQFVALVDKFGNVRKIYDCLKNQEMEELEKDVRDLLKERSAPVRFANSLYTNTP